MTRMRLLGIFTVLAVHNVLAFTVSEYFQLFNVNDINNKNNHLASYPVGTNSHNDVVLGAKTEDILSVQIDYNGFVKISGSDKYLTVDTSNNNKVSVASTTDKSHIFFISSNQLHFDQYFIFVACPNSESQYELHVGNDKSICSDGVLVNLRPISLQTSNAINVYVPDILRTSQGIAIAGGSSLSFLLSTTAAPKTNQDITSIAATAKSSQTGSVSPSSLDDKTTTVLQTVYASQQTGNVYISLSRSYKLLTFLSTTLVPYTSSYTSTDVDTVVVVTTIHTLASKCETTVATSYVMATSTSHSCLDNKCSKVTATVTLSSSSLSLLTSLTDNSTSLSLLTTRTHNDTALPTATLDNSTFDDNSLALYGGSATLTSASKSLAASHASTTSNSSNIAPSQLGNSSFWSLFMILGALFVC